MTVKGEAYPNTWDLLWLFLPESVSLIQTKLEDVLPVKRQKILMLQMLQMSINSLDVVSFLDMLNRNSKSHLFRLQANNVLALLQTAVHSCSCLTNESGRDFIPTC